ncbi:MAG: lysylphosphatidylglycerol synthase domain-containing protein, partial [Chloroflexota bacterium]
MADMWRRRVFWIGMLLSFFLLALFFRGASLDKIWESVLHANYFLVIPAILSYFIAVWWRAVRWRFLLSPLGRFAPHRLLSPILSSFAINNLVPGRVGLFIVSGFLVGEREKISKIASGATALTAQIFDGLVLLLIVIAISFTAPLSGWVLQMSRVTIALYSMLMFPFFFAAFNPGLMCRLGHFVSRPLPPPWQEKVRRWLELALSGVAAVRSLPNFTLILITSL